MATRGGHKTRAFLASARGKLASGANQSVVAGFLDKRDTGVVAQLEYGSKTKNMPPRPAFRQGIAEMERPQSEVRTALKREAAKVIGRHGGDPNMGNVGRAAVDTLQESYHALTNPPNAPSRIAKKGHSDVLVGEDGPRLISRIDYE